MKKKINVKLLKQICRAILHEPRRLDMYGWIYDEEIHGMACSAPCGTAACIGGFAVILSRTRSLANKPWKKAVQSCLADAASNSEFRDDAIARAAQKLLGLTHAQADRLFAPSNWPEEFVHVYENGRSSAKRAKAAVDRIKLFIETNGRI
jgi:hypothetical protein